jgi:hypothetical protein
MQNGKGSKRRPESNPGKYVQNYDEIKWSGNSSSTHNFSSTRKKQSFNKGDSNLPQNTVTFQKEIQPFPEPPE